MMSHSCTTTPTGRNLTNLQERRVEGKSRKAERPISRATDNKSCKGDTGNSDPQTHYTFFFLKPCCSRCARTQSRHWTIGGW